MQILDIDQLLTELKFQKTFTSFITLYFFFVFIALFKFLCNLKKTSRENKLKKQFLVQIESFLN